MIQDNLLLIILLLNPDLPFSNTIRIIHQTIRNIINIIIIKNIQLSLVVIVKAVVHPVISQLVK